MMIDPRDWKAARQIDIDFGDGIHAHVCALATTDRKHGVDRLEGKLPRCEPRASHAGDALLLAHGDDSAVDAQSSCRVSPGSTDSDNG